jgi:hypothetical protein
VVGSEADNRTDLTEKLEAEVGDLDSRLLTGLDRGMACAAERAEQASRAAGADADIETRVGAGLDAVLEAAAADPDLARLCLVEAPGLGLRALERREAGLQRFVEWLERQLPPSDGAGAVPALAAEMVVGGVYEVLQRKARAGEISQLPTLAPELRALWLPALRGR